MNEQKQKSPFSQVAVWPATTVGADKIKEFEDFMKSEYGVRVKYIEEIKTFPDVNQDGIPVENTGGRNDVFFGIYAADIPAFAVKRFSMDPPVRWIEDVLGNEKDTSIYPERVNDFKTWNFSEEE